MNTSNLQDQQTVPKRLRRLETIYGSRYRPLFFVTICTTDRKRMLDNDYVHKSFFSFCEKSPSIANVYVGKYVLMPDHIHLFVSCEGSKALSKWVKALKGSISGILRRQGVQSPHWQRSFFDHLLRSGESYSEKWEYVRRNPVRAGLVNDVDDWPFAGEIDSLMWD